MVAAWKRRTNQRAVQTITRHVVEICHQMESWRRLLRHLERLAAERDAAAPPLLFRHRGPGDPPRTLPPRRGLIAGRNGPRRSESRTAAAKSDLAHSYGRHSRLSWNPTDKKS